MDSLSTRSNTMPMEMQGYSSKKIDIECDIKETFQKKIRSYELIGYIFQIILSNDKEQFVLTPDLVLQNPETNEENLRAGALDSIFCEGRSSPFRFRFRLSPSNTDLFQKALASQSKKLEMSWMVFKYEHMDNISRRYCFNEGYEDKPFEFYLAQEPQINISRETDKDIPPNYQIEISLVPNLQKLQSVALWFIYDGVSFNSINFGN